MKMIPMIMANRPSTRSCAAFWPNQAQLLLKKRRDQVWIMLRTWAKQTQTLLPHWLNPTPIRFPVWFIQAQTLLQLAPIFYLAFSVEESDFNKRIVARACEQMATVKVSESA
jgi:hypothetical protein